MSDEAYPEGGAEWVDETALKSAHETNMALLEEKYNYDLMAFRRDFAAKLAMHGALDGKNGWALFNADIDADVRSSAEDGMKEVLILSYPAPESGNQLESLIAAGDSQTEIASPFTPSEEELRMSIPILRIITNEPFRVGRRIFCISEDIAFDEEGDMFVTIDSTAMNDRSFEDCAELSENVAAADRLSEEVEPLGAVFMFDPAKNRLAMDTFRPRPPFYVVQDPDDPDNILSPFGFPTELEDKIHTLQRARYILASVMDLTPEHTMGNGRS